MHEFKLDFSMTAFDKIINHTASQRTGPIQGNNGADIFKITGSQPSQKVSHSRAF